MKDALGRRSRGDDGRGGYRVAALIALAAAGCRGDSTGTQPPAVVEAASTAAITGTVGTPLATAPAFVVRDAAGRTVGGVSVSIAVTEGGGSLRSSPTRSANGPTSVGQWTLGTRAGRNALTVTVAGLPPIVIEATGVAGPAVALSVASGDGQGARAGAPLAQPIAARVVDAFGNGVAGVTVTFTVAKGGGALTGVTATSDGDGVASGASWTLGRTGGDQEVLATAQLGAAPASATYTAHVLSDYDVSLRFFGTPPSQEIAASFTNAANRIHALVVGDLPDINLTAFDAGRCGVTGVTLNEVVDDLIIFATVTPIDGAGRILGSAGPCIIRSSGRLAVIGVMRFDVDDLNNLVASGRLEPVILHEMLHVVGVGSLWRTLNLVDATGTPDPRYIGPLATARCNSANGQGVCGPSVPIENSGSAGTIEVHWREATFNEELMTGFVEGVGIAMPLSAITAASLEDYGFQVNYLSVDPYAVPTAAPRLRRPPVQESEAQWETIETPLFDVTPSGWMRPLRLR